MEGLIEASRLKVPVRDKHGTIGRAIDARKPTARRRINRRGAGAPPVRRRLRMATRRTHRASQRQAPVLPGLNVNRTQAEGPAVALVAADAKR